MTANTAPKLMDGSSSSKSYLLIGRRGDIALGMKIMGLMPSPTGTDHTYVACKVRSSAYGQDVEHEETEEKVVSLADKNLTFESAWPNIKFDKSGGERASTVVGFFVRGRVTKDPLKVMEQLVDGDGLKQLVDFICDAAGSDNLVLRRGAILEWLHKGMLEGYEAMKKRETAKAEFEASVEENVGIIGFQAQQMKALLKQEEAEAEEQATIVKKTPEEVEASEEETEEE